ncbi:hypothetical protein PanWU01x14_171180 [Parasponia andersonii]|uniref:Uncharacterized protein n=1 Tax=Parasponia andersonii TaxID=3476 RepID=A0A2P5C9K9_PARAD|nr:hypothetical protein PanWU01x14_171180 [Parasponia andersonii]
MGILFVMRKKSDGKSERIEKKSYLGLPSTDSQNPILGSSSAFLDSRGLLLDGSRAEFAAVSSHSDPSFANSYFFKVRAADPSHGSDLVGVGKSAQAGSLGDDQHSKFQILGAYSTYGLRFEYRVTIYPQRLDAKSDSKLQYAHVSNKVEHGNLQVANDALGLNFVADRRRTLVRNQILLVELEI